MNAILLSPPRPHSYIFDTCRIPNYLPDNLLYVVQRKKNGAVFVDANLCQLLGFLGVGGSLISIRTR